MTKKGRWKSEWDPLLGTVSDQVLAERLGVSRMTIKRHRWAGGVKPFAGMQVVQCSWCGKDIKRKRNTPDVSCVPCVKTGKREAYRVWRKANAARYRAYMRAWHARMKEHNKEWRARWEAAHPQNLAKYREQRNAHWRAKKQAEREAAIDRRVEAEIRAERERLGMEHYGWARNSDG